MKIGVEEEFIVVDAETLFQTPAAFTLASALAYQDFSLFSKHSVELPLSSRSFSTIIKNLKKAFSVIEIKTSPHSDIELIREELIFLREQLRDIAEEKNLLVLPTGLHPLFSTVNSMNDNCAALHVHVDYQKGVYEKIKSFIPFLISISTNSPFINGVQQAMSSRLLISPYVGIPGDKNGRYVDLLHNKKFNTIEVRMFDSQVTVDESVGLASIVRGIAESEDNEEKLTTDGYKIQRETAVKNGFKSIKITDSIYEELHGLNRYSRKIFDKQNGSDWQIEVFKRYGFSGLVRSLWESYKRDKKIMRKTSKDIDTIHLSIRPLLYFIPYLPFFSINKFEKCRRDIEGLVELFKSMLKY
jgi:hypothetical protein